MAGEGVNEKQAALVDFLVDGLRSEGTVDSEGEFMLDRAQAQKKTAELRLVDPHSYVLELVQAAVLKGATRLSARIDGASVRLRFDGRPFEVSGFEDLYATVFTRARGTPDHRALRELALGVSAALALDPQRIRVYSQAQGEARGAELLLRPHKEDRYGTTGEARKRIGRGFTTLIQLDFPGIGVAATRAEARFVETRCRYAQISIRCFTPPPSAGPKSSWTSWCGSSCDPTSHRTTAGSWVSFWGWAAW